MAAPALLSVALALSPSVSVRLATRNDLIPLAVLVEESFAAGRNGNLPIDYSSARKRSWLERQVTTARVALDIEQRQTPWDWCRHAQLVAEGDDGQIVGFCEVWGEDAKSLRNESAQTPQPVVFNLCVAASARRTGVAQALLRRCEEASRSWGDRQLYLKVREDNAPANRLYEGDGWKHLEMRVAELPAWQERWKGGVRPLRLMRKPLRVGAGLSRSGVTPAKSFDEFRVTIDTVLAYDDPEALVWFGLLMVRNAKFLSPQYRVLPGLLALIVWGAYFGTIRLLSHPEIVPDALRALGISAAAVAAAP